MEGKIQHKVYLIMCLILLIVCTFSIITYSISIASVHSGCPKRESCYLLIYKDRNDSLCYGKIEIIVDGNATGCYIPCVFKGCDDKGYYHTKCERFVNGSSCDPYDEINNKIYCPELACTDTVVDYIATISLIAFIIGIVFMTVTVIIWLLMVSWQWLSVKNDELPYTSQKEGGEEEPLIDPIPPPLPVNINEDT